MEIEIVILIIGISGSFFTALFYYLSKRYETKKRLEFEREKWEAEQKWRNEHKGTVVT